VKELRAIVAHLNASPEAHAVLATLVSAAGSSYRRPGARLLLCADGRRIGSISGGCLEEDVLAHAQRVAETGVAEVIRYDTTSENDLVWGVGLGCHGIVHVLVERLPRCPEWANTLAANWETRQPTNLAVTWGRASPQDLGTRLRPEEMPQNAQQISDVFVECIHPPTRLLIFGAGDDAQPLHRVGNELGWDVVVADPRSTYATPARFPAAQRVISGPAEDLVARAKPDANSVAVVMTHHYVHDVPILRALLPLNLRYVGLLGPKKRGVKILRDIATAGTDFPEQHQARLRSPIGLDIGAETPEEVAASIVAEILAVLSGRAGGALKNRDRPIHEPSTSV